MSVYQVYAVHLEARGGSAPLPPTHRTSVPDSCELALRVPEWNLHPLEAQHVLLTTEPPEDTVFCFETGSPFVGLTGLELMKNCLLPGLVLWSSAGFRCELPQLLSVAPVLSTRK